MPLSDEQSRNITAILEWSALSLWAGGSLTLSLFALPQAFRLLPRSQAGLYAGGIFPIYFMAGAILLAVIFWFHFRNGIWSDLNARAKTIFLALAALGTVINLAVALPKIEGIPQMTAPVEERQKAFKMWHAVSMAANGLVLIACVPVVALTATRRSGENPA